MRCVAAWLCTQPTPRVLPSRLCRSEKAATSGVWHMGELGWQARRLCMSGAHTVAPGACTPSEVPPRSGAEACTPSMNWEILCKHIENKSHTHKTAPFILQLQTADYVLHTKNDFLSVLKSYSICVTLLDTNASCSDGVYVNIYTSFGTALAHLLVHPYTLRHCFLPLTPEHNLVP